MRRDLATQADDPALPSGLGRSLRPPWTKLLTESRGWPIYSARGTIGAGLGHPMRGAGIGLGIMLMAVAPARAQLRLPGAVAPAPVGSHETPGMGGRAHPAAPPPLRAPGEDSIVGRELRLNGEAGLIAFQRADQDLRITQLSLPGNQISRPADACRVDVGGPIALRPAPRHDGLVSYSAEIPACPLTIDVLEGAVKVSAPGGQCVFRRADCTVTPSGVWGPPGSSIGPGEARVLEKARAAAESNVRSYYRALIASAKKDRNQVKAIAAEQAGFSSMRAMTCRDYAGEDKHGFCAARITEAHALALRAELYPQGEEKPAPAHRKRLRHKPAAPQAAR
jgi:hypothetical protein